MQRHLRYEISFHATGILNPFPVKSQKVTRFHERMPVQKHLNFFVLFLLCKSDDFLNHFDIAQRPNIVVIRPVRDRGCVADVDIILNIRHVKTTIVSGEVYRSMKFLFLLHRVHLFIFISYSRYSSFGIFAA